MNPDLTPENADRIVAVIWEMPPVESKTEHGVWWKMRESVRLPYRIALSSGRTICTVDGAAKFFD